MSNSRVFVPDDDFIWLSGIITDELTESNELDVLIDDPDYTNKGEVRRIDLSDLPHELISLPLQNTNLPSDGIADMCTMDYLHEASILDNLRRRHFSKCPYTYIQEICIAVNPYQWLDIYTEDLRRKHLDGSRSELAPHVYATSSAAYRSLLNTGRNQSILVSGESGAGKTETVKILMEHLAGIASRPGDETIDKVLKANPLLESFGNAKTLRNDNSSRFGKFTQLQFDEECYLIGSKCDTYLLEKSRLVTQNDGERNYHIFHQLLSAPKSAKARLRLSNLTASDFTYTCFGDVHTKVIEGKRDFERYSLTMQSLSLLGVSESLRDSLEHALAGILFLGQVTFLAEGEHGEACSLNLRSPEQEQELNLCCSSLGIPTEAFLTATTSRTITVGGSSIVKNLPSEQATAGRDALAKEIYARIFRWLVLVINFNTYDKTAPLLSAGISSTKSYGSVLSLTESEFAADLARLTVGSGQQDQGKGNDSSNGTDVKRSIALLDIFGFECFDINRFEQLCINYANEKLQQKFTHDVFQIVLCEYKEEGLNWELMRCPDNSHILDLVEGKGGLVSALNEECLIPKGGDISYLSKVRTAWAGHSAFSCSPLSKDEFSIQHYAGEVTYTVTGFLERNKDTLPEDLRELVAKSSNPLLQQLFSSTPISTGSLGSDLFTITGSSSEVDAFLAGGSRDVVAAALLLAPPPAAPPAAAAVDTDTEIDSDMKSKSAKSTRSFHGSSLPSRNNSAVGLLSPPAEDDSSSSMRAGAPSGAASGSGASGAALRKREGARGKMTNTLILQFKSQLSKLMSIIGTTQVQYVRCVKPNEEKSNVLFDRLMVVDQLRCAGMTEAVRITRANYPNRILKGDFFERFKRLRKSTFFTDQVGPDIEAMAELHRAVDESDRKCRLLVASLVAEVIKMAPELNEINVETRRLFEVGKTKVYFVGGVLEKMETVRNAVVFETARYLQLQLRHALKMWRARRRYLNLRRAVIAIQAKLRGRHFVHSYRRALTAAKGLQAWMRMGIARCRFHRSIRSVLLIQNTVRVFVRVRYFKRLKAAVTTIQSMIRAVATRRKYLTAIRAVVCIQARCRVILAKKKVALMRRGRAAAAMQSMYRMSVAARRFKRLKKGILVLQKAARRRRERLLFEASMLDRIRLIIRGYMQMKRYRNTLQKIVKIQSVSRGRSARRIFGLFIREYRRTKNAAKNIQAVARGFLVRRQVHRMRVAAVVIQAVARMRYHRNRLSKLVKEEALDRAEHALRIALEELSFEREARLLIEERLMQSQQALGETGARLGELVSYREAACNEIDSLRVEIDHIRRELAAVSSDDDSDDVRRGGREGGRRREEGQDPTTVDEHYCETGHDASASDGSVADVDNRDRPSFDDGRASPADDVNNDVSVSVDIDDVDFEYSEEANNNTINTNAASLSMSQSKQQSDINDADTPTKTNKQSNDRDKTSPTHATTTTSPSMTRSTPPLPRGPPSVTSSSARKTDKESDHRKPPKLDLKSIDPDRAITLWEIPDSLNKSEAKTSNSKEDRREGGVSDGAVAASSPSSSSGSRLVPAGTTTPSRAHHNISSSPKRPHHQRDDGAEGDGDGPPAYDREGWIWKMGGHYFFSKRYRQRFILLDSRARELRWSKLPETINDPAKIKGYLKLESGMVCTGSELHSREYVVEIKSSSPTKTTVVGRSPVSAQAVPTPSKQGGVVMQFMLHEETEFLAWVKALNVLLASL